MRKGKALVVKGGAEPSELDLQIFKERLGGQSERDLARKFGLSMKEVWRAIDRALPTLDTAARARAIAIEYSRLDSLFATFFEKAKGGDAPAATVCLKIHERRAIMMGLECAPRRDDPTQAQIERRMSSTEIIKRALDRIANERTIEGQVIRRGPEPTPAPAQVIVLEPELESEPEPAA
jgi:hypothetical protein